MILDRPVLEKNETANESDLLRRNEDSILSEEDDSDTTDEDETMLDDDTILDDPPMPVFDMFGNHRCW